MAIVDLKTPKSIDLPTPEKIKDLETRGLSKKLMSSLDDVHKKIHEDLKTLWRVVTGLDEFVIENRTDDPASPVTGQIWFRTDL